MLQNNLTALPLIPPKGGKCQKMRSFPTFPRYLLPARCAVLLICLFQRHAQMPEGYISIAPRIARGDVDEGFFRAEFQIPPNRKKHNICK